MGLPKRIYKDLVIDDDQGVKKAKSVSFPISIRSLLVNLFLGCTGIIIALFLIEVAYRISGFDKRVTWSDRPKYYYKPEISDTMQDYRYQKAKDVSTFRIAVVGDSFSFAPYMQFDDAFPKKLERMLNLSNSGIRAEVINFGVPGYSTSHEVATVKKAIVDYNSDLIILQITLNDPQIKPYRPTGIRGVNDYAAYDISSETGIFKYWKSASLVRSRIYNTKTHKAYKDYYFSLFDKKGAPWRSFVSSLKRIKRIVSKHDVKLVAVIFPLFGLPLNNSYPFLPIHQNIANLCDALGISHLDLFEAYKDIPLVRLQVIPSKDFHPNEIGHRIAAERIYDWLSSNDFIPPELRIKDFFESRINIVPR